MIAIDDLHKSYRTADGRLSAVLKGLSLQVPERSITAVVGPSGAGKSTLARCISLCCDSMDCLYACLHRSNSIR